MSRVIRLLKRWINMLLGKSNFHVEQGVGKCYSLKEIKGYYNDLTKKVSDSIELDENGIPVNITITGLKTHFPIAVFQYGLGLYDLYLLKKDDKYIEKFMNIADWSLDQQQKKGMWDCMGKLKDSCHKTQSAMCQSEGASVLLRAYCITNNIKYYDAAKKAIDFMLKDIKDGGTCLYDNENVIFQEYVSEYNLSVMNGWIFSIFGLFDFTLINKEKKYKMILNKTITSLCKCLPHYDRTFWTNYDLVGTIASPAYHDLHIRQLQLLYKMFGKNDFAVYAKKWEKYQKSKLNIYRAMLVKLFQKIKKNKYYDINTTTV